MFGTQKKEETESLAHTRWNCKYHIVFAPKYRRQEIYGQIRVDIGQILRKLCEYKGVEIIEAETCPDHIHMLVSIPPKYSVSQFMGYLKGKSSLMIFDRHANLKYKYGNRQFWCKGYYVDTVGRNKKAIAEYIRNQLIEDKIPDQISLKEYMDPFTGEQVKRSNHNHQFTGGYDLKTIQQINKSDGIIESIQAEYKVQPSKSSKHKSIESNCQNFSVPACAPHAKPCNFNCRTLTSPHAASNEIEQTFWSRSTQ